jgi:hypothetical protein
MTWKAGDKILYHGVREATLIKPMTPYGMYNASTKTEGQCWEMKFPDLPCTVYRWLYPAVDSVTVEAKKMEGKQ